MDALGNAIDSTLDSCIHNVADAMRKLHELKDVAHIAQQNDMQAVLASTGTGMGTLYNHARFCLM
jgi:hypothetical protein